MSKAAAFFDLDRTVISGSSLYPFGRAALRSGMYSTRQLVKDAWTQFWFKRRSSSDTQSVKIQERVLSGVIGYNQTDLKMFGPQMLLGCLKKLYPDVYRIIRRHEAAGVPTFLVSAAPVEIVGAVASALMMSGGAIATVAEVDSDGNYTGRLVGDFCYGAAKAQAIADKAKELDIDLAQSFSYSDSASDLPMLELVGHPTPVNPDKHLRKSARENGWDSIRVEPRHALRFGIAAGSVIAVGAASTTYALLRKRG